MQPHEPLALRSLPVTVAVPTVSQWRVKLARSALIAVVEIYLLTILIGPVAALVVELLEVGIGNALQAIVSPDALSALWMTVILTFIAVVVNAFVGTFGAIAIVRHKFIGRSTINALCDLPLAVSPVMIGLAFILLVGRNSWLGQMLDSSGVRVAFAFPGLVIATLFVTLPYTIREVVYVLEEIGTSEEEAAITLGASSWQTFVRVTLPNIRIGLGYGLLMTTARSLGEFGAVLVLGGSISGQTQTATTFIHDAAEERQHAGAYGMALVLALASVFSLLALEWAKNRGQHKVKVPQQ